MKSLWILPMMLAFVAGVLAWTGQTESHANRADKSDVERGIYQEHARRRYGALNRKLDGRLEPLFSQLGNVYAVHDFITDDKTRPLYKQLLVAVLERSMKGKVLDAMFTNFMLSLTPPKLVADAIAVEIEPGGRLEGLLDRPGSDVRKHIEGRVPVHPKAYIEVEPNFRHYLSCLSPNRREDHDALIEHMFRTDPHAAVYAFIESTNSLRDKVNVRNLVYLEHLVEDMCWHHRHRFELDMQRQRKAMDALKELSRHNQWWVRLYVAEIVSRHPEFRTPEIVQRLQKDKNKLVRDAVARKARDNPRQPQKLPDSPRKEPKKDR